MVRLAGEEDVEAMIWALPFIILIPLIVLVYIYFYWLGRNW
jgi:hypothetical protein